MDLESEKIALHSHEALTTHLHVKPIFYDGRRKRSQSQLNLKNFRAIPELKRLLIPSGDFKLTYY